MSSRVFKMSTFYCMVKVRKIMVVAKNKIIKIWTKLDTLKDNHTLTNPVCLDTRDTALALTIEIGCKS